MRDPEDNLNGLSLGDVQEEISVNLFSPLFAAGEAIKGFRQLPGTASRTFIFTGNALNTVINPGALTFAMGKTATAQMVSFASVAYRNQGYKCVQSSSDIFLSDFVLQILLRRRTTA